MTDRYLEHAIRCLNRAKENSTDGVYCELSIPEVDMILDLLKEQEGRTMIIGGEFTIPGNKMPPNNAEAETAYAIFIDMIENGWLTVSSELLGGGEMRVMWEMKKLSRLEEGREIVQVKLNEDGANTELDDDMMTIDDFIQELNIAIKQDGHDIYMKRDDATMIKQIIINHSNIVRCKDCKFLPSSSPGCHMFCERIHNFVDADWFCADGKRR